MVGGKRIVESDVIVENGIVHRIDGLLLPALANPIVPRHCNTETSTIVKVHAPLAFVYSDVYTCSLCLQRRAYMYDVQLAHWFCV